MGYACPVCETPQADAEHLANHLAFTAMLHDDAHAAYLDERVPDWADRTPADLAAAVAADAPEAEYDAVFEDTTEAHSHAHDHDHDHDEAPLPTFEAAIARQGRRGRAALDGEAERILTEARELTERMRRDGDDTEPESDPEDAEE